MLDVGHDRPPARRDPTLAALLGVELLLLAFFILMTSIANFEPRRTRSVLDSVQAAFAGVAAPGRVAGDDRRAIDALRAELDGLIETAVPLTRVEETQDAAVMQFELPAAAFFRPGESRVDRAQGLLFERLVAVLNRRPAGYVYDIAVLHGSAGAAGIEIDRVGSLVGSLLAHGAPAEALSAGLFGKPGWIRFVIRLHEGGRPRAAAAA